MFKYEDVRTVHLEVSEACNASCPMCDRFRFGGESSNPIVKNKSINLHYFKQIFPKKFIQQLDQIIFCGVLGDPIMAKDLLKQVQYCLDVNSKLSILISTNGSIRPKAWWQSLGRLCNSKNKRVAFAIDGMSDTHHIYRRNTSWENIIENAKAFIEAGGFAECQFIRFAHNEHQEEKLKKFASNMGFKIFDAKDSERFIALNENDYRYPVRNLGEQSIAYFLEPPSHFTPGVYTKKDLDSSKINCHVWKSKEIYVSAKGRVYPCCYLFSDISHSPESYSHILENSQNLEVSPSNSVENIVNGAFFKEVSLSWEKESLAKGKLKKCAETCGINLRAVHNSENLLTKNLESGELFNTQGLQ